MRPVNQKNVVPTLDSPGVLSHSIMDKFEIVNLLNEIKNPLPDSKVDIHSLAYKFILKYWTDLNENSTIGGF